MEKELLRFTTTGSVDDGKSTLIGRLLYECKAIFEDQYLAIKKTSRRRGQGEVDLSLLLDGLAAEREQGITIDVAYRYFATPRRRFIIADTPGHEQYTRNMLTGASHAQLAIILIDARKGVLTQSRRHGFLLSLLQVPHLVVAVNKMDLVDYDEQVFQQIVADYSAYSTKLEIRDISFVPVSALVGDNLTTRSHHMPWYQGSTLLHLLENVEIGADRNLIDFRFPVQYVLRPDQHFRGYAGKVASGQIRPGEPVAVLPSGKTARIQSIVTWQGEEESAGSGDSVVLTLDQELDISRGDMLVRPHNLPLVEPAVDAMLCWLDDQPMIPTRSYLLKQTTRTVQARIQNLRYLVDVNNLARRPADRLALNEIGRAELQLAQALAFDPYRVNPATGSFILIDPETCHTVAAGMIRGPVRRLADLVPAANEEVTQGIGQASWARRNGHQAAVIWLTGLSGAGKSTLAAALSAELFARFCQVATLDGDHLRGGLCQDLGFSPQDRAENIRRAGEVASLFYQQGNLVICSFISPFRADRERVRSLLPSGAFLEVFVDCALEICQQRDPKGLYQKALAGEIPDFTGLTSTYEPPLQAELTLPTDQLSITACVHRMLEMLKAKQILPA